MTKPFDDDELEEFELDENEIEDDEPDAMTRLGQSADGGRDVRPIVYVRKIAAGDLPKPIFEQLSEAQPTGVAPETVFYAVCDQGRTIGLFDDRDMAFFQARSHSLTPVSVH